MMRQFIVRTLAVVALIGVGPACTVINTVQQGGVLRAKDRWVILPMINHSQTPQAAEGLESMLSTLLRVVGIGDLSETPAPKEDEGLPVLNQKRRLQEAQAWAKSEDFNYGVTGSVEEWRYRGLDGQPAAGLTIRVIDLKTGKVVWSASGARSGWGRETISGTAQTLISKLLKHMRLKR